MTRDDVQKKITLTGDQQKAWSQLVRAVNKCKKEKIFFYQVLETLHGLNGKNVEKVIGDEVSECMRGKEEFDLNWLSYPSVKTKCSFADDTHYVVLK